MAFPSEAGLAVDIISPKGNDVHFFTVVTHYETPRARANGYDRIQMPNVTPYVGNPFFQVRSRMVSRRLRGRGSKLRPICWC